MEKKISEKKLRNSYLLHSPKNSLSNKRCLLKSELREKIIKAVELIFFKKKIIIYKCIKMQLIK